MGKTWMAAALLAALAGAPGSGGRQEQGKTANELDAEAIQAYRAKNYGGFLEDEKQAMAKEPENPRLLYNVACGEALTGHAGEAVKLLDELAARKLDLGAENDGDFAGIRKTAEWSGYVAKLAELRKPLVRSEVAFRLYDPALAATGLAVDERTGETYIASVRQRKILVRTKDGSVRDFVTQGQDGFLAGASLAIDGPRGLLYASTAAAPFMEGFRKEEFGKAGVYAFDLKTGKTERRAMLAAEGKPHFLNALAVDREGNVYVSDSGASGIYRLGRGADQLTEFIAPQVFAAAQGLAFSKDEKTLYVADFTDGVWALDMATKQRKRLEGPAKVWLGGLDGLTRDGDGLLAVQIGAQPERVLRLGLDGQRHRIASVKILEMNRPDYDGPIQGTMEGGAFLYIANSQLELGNVKTGGFAVERARPTVVLRLPVESAGARRGTGREKTAAKK